MDENDRIKCAALRSAMMTVISTCAAYEMCEPCWSNLDALTLRLREIATKPQEGEK